MFNGFNIVSYYMIYIYTNIIYIPILYIYQYCIYIYNLVPWHSYGKFIINGGFMGKSSVNGPFSIAMLNKQRVCPSICSSISPTSCGLRQIPLDELKWTKWKSHSFKNSSSVARLEKPHLGRRHLLWCSLERPAKILWEQM